jgi:hypothetical protein
MWVDGAKDCEQNRRVVVEIQGNDFWMWPERSRCGAAKSRAIRAEQSVVKSTRQELSNDTRKSAVGAPSEAVEAMMENFHVDNSG